MSAGHRIMGGVLFAAGLAAGIVSSGVSMRVVTRPADVRDASDPWVIEDAVRRVVRDELSRSQRVHDAAITVKPTLPAVPMPTNEGAPEEHQDAMTADDDEREEILDGAHAEIARAIERGVWTRDDAAMLRDTVGRVGIDAGREVLDTVLAAVNAQKLRPEAPGVLF